MATMSSRSPSGTVIDCAAVIRSAAAVGSSWPARTLTTLAVSRLLPPPSATTVSAFVLAQDSDVPPPAPQISVSHGLVDDGSEQTVAVTLEGGNAVATDQLYVAGSKPLDIGGAPGSGTPAN